MGMSQEEKVARDNAARNAKLEEEINADYRKRTDSYNNDFDTRMANIIELEKQARGRLGKLNSGSDAISDVYRNELYTPYAEARKAIESTTRFAGRLGMSGQGDAGYNNKLQYQSMSELSKAIGDAQAGAVSELKARDEGTLIDATQAYNQDKQLGLGLVSNTASMANSSFGTYSNIRQQAAAANAAKWNKIFGVGQMVVGGLTGFATGLGGVASLVKPKAGGGGGSTQPYAPSYRPGGYGSF